jgi:PAS domain S-box-containing protein
VWMECIGKVMSDAQGQISGFILSSRDVTKRKNVEEQVFKLNAELEQHVAERTTQLEKSEIEQRAIADNLTAIFNTATDGIAVIDNQGNFVTVNDAFAKLHGYSCKEDVINKPAMDLIAERDREIAVKYLDQVLRGGPVRNIEYRLARQDGTEFYGEVSAAPIYNESNVLTRFVFITRDATQRKANEQTLRASQEYARNIIDSSLDMIIAVDNERRITEFNQAAEEIFGYRRDEVLGKSVELLYADSVESRAVYSQTMFQGRNVRQIQNRTKSGRIFPALLSASILLDPNGTPIGSMGISRDITKVTRAEEEQKRLFQQVRAGRERLQLLSKRLLDAQESERRNIARELHDEIGQAITGVQMNLQLIQPFVTNRSAMTRLEDTTLAIERMLQQIRNLSLDLRPSILDDFGLVPALRWLIERQTQLNGLDIQFNANLLEKRPAEQIETVCFRLTQEALTNITRHAEAQHVSIQLRPIASDLELTIQDDGIGFDVTQAIQRAAQGNSVGLLGMQERAMLVGGKLEISSAPHQGTRIQLIIPLNGATAFKERRRQRRSSHETHSGSVS